MIGNFVNLIENVNVILEVYINVVYFFVILLLIIYRF